MNIDKSLLNAALQALFPEFPHVGDKINHLIKHKGIPGFVQEWKKLKAWAVQLISGNRYYKEDWFCVQSYLGYNIPRRYKDIFQPLVRILVASDMSPRKANGFGRSLRVILSLLNLHHSVKGPYKPDMVKQVAAATADVVTPEKARFDFWKAGLGLACYAINKKLSSNLGPLLPTGQQTAPRPGFNCSWAEFVSTDAFQLLAGFDHKLTPQKLARKKFLTSGSFMGNLTFIGETGGKTRTILVAHPVLQCQLRYLKDQLLELLRSIPTDTMWDQNRGVEFIKEAQRVGKTIYSVDLKDATWNFPRSLQEEVLRDRKSVV